MHFTPLNGDAHMNLKGSIIVRDARETYNITTQAVCHRTFVGLCLLSHLQVDSPDATVTWVVLRAELALRHSKWRGQRMRTAPWWEAP